MKNESPLPNQSRRAAGRINRALPLLAGIALSALVNGADAQPTPKLYEDFESGNLNRWTQMYTPALSIANGTNIVPLGGNYAALYPSSGAKMRASLDSAITDKYDSCSASVWIYDYAEPQIMTNRPFLELRSYSGGTYGSGNLDQILAIGVYNTWTVTPINNAKYSGRVYTGSPGGWFTLNNAPDRSVGWHHFAIERGTNGNGDCILKFFQDEIMGAIFTNVASSGYALSNWDTVLFGLGAGTSAGSAYADGFRVVQGQAFIGDEPRGSTNQVGTSASLTVGAYGSASTLSYWWYKDGVRVSDDARISGSTGRTLTINSLQAGDSGWYSVIVSNVWGARSNAFPARLEASGIIITTQPTNQVVNLGSNNVSFYAEANGSGNLYYQWKKDGAIISGASGTGAHCSYTIPVVGASDIATNPGYVCIVTNQAGDAMSSAAATLRSNAPPWIAAIPNLATNLNTSIAISVTVTDDYSSMGIFQNFESSSAGTTVTFDAPSFSGTSSPLYVEGASARAYVTNLFPTGNLLAGNRTYFLSMNFTNTGTAGWDRLTTLNFNPIVSFNGPLKFDIRTDRPMGVCVGLRETNPTGELGQNGGSTGPIELAGVSQNNTPPVPIYFTAANTWTNLTFDLANPSWAYIYKSGLVTGNDGVLDSTTGFGVLECLGLTPAAGLGVYNIYLDNLQSIPANAITFSLDPPSPANATIDPYSGLITWTTPAAASTTTFAVRVTDHFGLQTTKTFTITVPAAPARDTLHYALINGQLVLTWTNAAFPLESASAVTGSYTPISGASSPYTNNPAGTTRFFRLHWQQP